MTSGTKKLAHLLQIEKDYCLKIQEELNKENNNKALELLVNLNILKKFYK